MDVRRSLLKAGPAALPLALAALVAVTARLELRRERAAAAPSRYAALVAEAKLRTRATSVAALRARLDAAGPRPYLIDVREDREWDAGRLPGAIHVGRGVLERDIEKTVPDRDAEIVLYCATGGRSALAADALQRFGYARVYSLDGGAAAWFARAEPVARK